MISQKIAEFVEYIPDEDRCRFIDHIPGYSADSELLSGKYYVYVLMRPNGSVFYVGKGTRGRIDDHEREARQGAQSHKCSVIRKIWMEGGQIIKQKVAFFDNEEDAYELEKLLIAFFGRKNLTNITDGGEGNSASFGNNNASNARRGLPPGLAVHVSVRSSKRQGIEVKLASELGHEPSEDEVKAKIKALSLQAIDAYIDSRG
jgi:hypothetical protein